MSRDARLFFGAMLMLFVLTPWSCEFMDWEFKKAHQFFENLP